MASRHPGRVQELVVGGFAMHAYRDEVTRTLTPLAEHLRAGDWAAVWRAFGVSDTEFAAMMEADNDPQAVAAAVAGSMSPTRYVDPASVTCPAIYYVGSRDWIVPHVRADVAAVGATLDEIPGQTHLGTFYGAAEQVLAAVTARLG